MIIRIRIKPLPIIACVGLVALKTGAEALPRFKEGQITCVHTIMIFKMNYLGAICLRSKYKPGIAGNRKNSLSFFCEDHAVIDYFKIYLSHK